MLDAYREIDSEVAECTEALSRDPEPADYARRGEVYKRKVLIASKRGDHAVVESTLTMALNDFTQALNYGDKAQVSRAEWLQQRGILHKAMAEILGNGSKRRYHLESAESDFSDTLHVARSTTDVVLLRGEVRLALGHHDASIDDFSSAIPSATAHGKIQAFCGRSKAWVALHELQNALDDMSQAIQLCMMFDNVDKNELATLLYTRSEIASKMGNLDQCLADIGKSLELCPDKPDTLVRRAGICYSLGLYAEADGDVCDAIRLGAGHSAELSDLYRKLKLSQTVFLHLKKAEGLGVPGQPALYVQYLVRQNQGTSTPLVKGRTLTSREAEWDEVVQFHLPSREYTVELFVLNNNPENEVPFIGKCEVALLVTPSSKQETQLPLRSSTNKTKAAKLLRMGTGTRGVLHLAWHMCPRLRSEGEVVGTMRPGQPVLPPPPSDSRLFRAAGSHPTGASDFVALFNKHAPKGKQYITREAMKEIYDGYDGYGAPKEDLDSLLDRYQLGDEYTVSLDEFILVMMRLSGR